jgi:hypothetical protein
MARDKVRQEERQTLPRAAMALLLCVAAALAAGCVGQPFPAWSTESPAPAAAASTVHGVLETEPAGSRYRLPQSPWGEGVAVELRDLYTAASGRVCRRVTIDPSGARQPALACRTNGDEWEAVRVLHDDGRPVLQRTPQEMHARMPQ